MRYKLFGNTGLRVSEIALGAGMFGTTWGHGSEPAEARKMFDAYAEDIDDTAKRTAREKVRTHACTHAALRELLDAGVALRIIMVDGDDAPILQTEILRWECGGVATAESSR